MAIVTTFGELLLRLKTPGFQRFSQSHALEASFGGGEANVAVSLARFGHVARFVSALPEGPLGDWALGNLRALGVDVSHVLRRRARLGIYFLEAGASQRPSQVVYDRAGSALSELEPGQVDWAAALSEASWFHTTGITPALAAGCAALAAEALALARGAGVVTSVDLNHRSKLWSKDEAREVMTGLMAHTDLLIANEEDCDAVFGIRGEGTEVTKGTLDPRRYLEVGARVLERFPAVRRVAISLRESYSASRNGWSALLMDRSGHALSRRYELEVVDRVGAGDAFAAGIIHALLEGRTLEQAVEFAAAASALKHSIPGDLNLASLAEVEALAAGDGSGRVAR